MQSIVNIEKYSCAENNNYTDHYIYTEDNIHTAQDSVVLTIQTKRE